MANIDECFPLCERCHYDEGDADEPIPQRFSAWIKIVCHACSVKLRALDERYGDQEASSRGFT